MRNLRKYEKADLRKYYTLFLEIGLITVLLIFIVAMKIDFQSNQVVTNLIEQQEIFKMEKVIQTKQIESPPPPPRPQIPVEVPNNEVIEDQVIDISADLDLDAQMELPPPPMIFPKKQERKTFLLPSNRCQR